MGKIIIKFIKLPIQKILKEHIKVGIDMKIIINYVYDEVLTGMEVNTILDGTFDISEIVADYKVEKQAFENGKNFLWR